MNKEREVKSGISRRDFLRVATGLGLAAGGALSTWYFGKKGLEELGLRFEEDQSEQTSSKDFFDEEARILSQQTEQAPTQTSQPTPEATSPPEATTEPTPTPEQLKPLQFGKVDFESQQNIGMSYFLGEDQIIVPYFTPKTWRPGILSTGEFDPDKNTGLVYLDSENRKILNLHSGRRGPLDEQGYSMYQLQLHLEEHPNIGVRRYAREVDEIMKSTIGSEVVLKQGEEFTYSKIVAAVRVPPNLVNESKQHVYDINRWLAEKFPDSGFKNVLNEENEILTVKFCGRKLAGEGDIEAEGEPAYRQSRFFLASKLTQ